MAAPRPPPRGVFPLGFAAPPAAPRPLAPRPAPAPPRPMAPIIPVLNDTVRNLIDGLGGYPRYDLPYQEASAMKSIFNEQNPVDPTKTVAARLAAAGPPRPPAAPRGP